MRLPYGSYRDLESAVFWSRRWAHLSGIRYSVRIWRARFLVHPIMTPRRAT